MKVHITDLGEFKNEYEKLIKEKDDGYYIKTSDVKQFFTMVADEIESISITKGTELQSKIYSEIKYIGVPANIKGYEYLKDTILIYMDKPQRLSKIYQIVARNHNVTATSVEKAVRVAIETAWERGNPEILEKYFGYTISAVKGKPTNSEFIATIVDIINQKEENCI